MVSTAVAPKFVCLIPASPVTTCALNTGWFDASLESADAKPNFAVALVVVGSGEDTVAVRRKYPQALLVGTDRSAPVEGVDFDLDLEQHVNAVPQTLAHAEKYWLGCTKVNDLTHDLGLRRQRMHQLSQISLALTEQMSQHELLRTILTEARRIAHCDAGSLFLVAPDIDDTKSLVFKLAQNDVVDFPFVESRLPLTAGSIAGYVATSGHELNIRDVYQLSENVPYSFNRSFDDHNGYRTRSILAIAMRDHRERVVGVLQFINRVDRITGEIVDFDSEITEMLRAIASQAAVSIQKNALIEDINDLREFRASQCEDH